VDYYEVYLIKACSGQMASARDSGLNMLKLLKKCECKVFSKCN